MKTFIILATGILLLVSCGENTLNKVSTLNIPDKYEQRVDSVLKLMTLDEKIGQLNQYTGNWQATGPVVEDPTKIEQIKAGKVGSMLNIKSVKHTRELQEYAMQSRLRIPLMFGLDVVHGLRTIYPIPLGEAASFDLDLMRRTAAGAAKESSAQGVHWTFAPMVDISRDARWGRVMEGAGEIPGMDVKWLKLGFVVFREMICRSRTLLWLVPNILRHTERVLQEKIIIR